MLLNHHLGILGMDPVAGALISPVLRPQPQFTVRIFDFLQTFTRLFGVAKNHSLPKKSLEFLAQVQHHIVPIGLWDPEKFGDWQQFKT